MADVLAPTIAAPGTIGAPATLGGTAIRRPNARRRAVRGVLRSVRLGASAALLVAVIGIAVVTVVLPRLTGWTPLTVLTGSMSPTLPPGTLVVVEPVDPAALAVGDVVTYQLHSDDPMLVTHRIISISETAGSTTYELQGDNNPDPDIDPVLPEQVQGRVAYAVPLLGYVNSALSGAGRGWLVAGTAALLFGYAAYAILGATVEGARKRHRPEVAGRRSAR
jgi:signal peptidase